MSFHLIIGDKLHSSWSLRGALALDLAGAPYTETLIKLGQPDTRALILQHSATGKVPLLQTEHGTIADSLAIAEYLNERFPAAQMWPADRDRALVPMPAEAQADIDRMTALWAQCRAVATEPGPYLFGRLSLADAFFAPVAVRLRTYRVALSAEDEAYIDAIYQWPAFKAWQQAGLEEVQG